MQIEQDTRIIWYLWLRQFCDLWAIQVQTYLYFEAVEEINASCEFETHENPRHKFRPYRCDSGYLWMLLATRVHFLRYNITDLEGRQRNGWQRRCVIIESFGSGDSALQLDMRAETI